MGSGGGVASHRAAARPNAVHGSSDRASPRRSYLISRPLSPHAMYWCPVPLAQVYVQLIEAFDRADESEQARMVAGAKQLRLTVRKVLRAWRRRRALTRVVRCMWRRCQAPQRCPCQ